MPVIPLGFGQVNWVFAGPAVPSGAQVTCGFEHTGSDLNATECAFELSGAWQLTLHTRLVPSLHLVNTHIKYGPNDVGQEGDFASDLLGQYAGDELPPNLSLLVKKVTEAGGHANKGRFFVPGLNESQVDTGGQIDSSELGGFIDQCDALHALFVSAGLTPVVLHSVSSPVQIPTPITAFAPQQQAATQRRRMRR